MTRPELPYATPVCVILVGDEETKFQPYTGLLERTKFFDVHGPPKVKEPVRETAQAASAQEKEQSNAADFLFSDREMTEETEVPEPTVIDLRDEDADYVLQNKFCYTRDAFNIFYRHLNDAPVATPKDSDECEDLFKAYALAQCYDVPKLQNEIIGALQTFYTQNAVPVSHLIFAVNRFKPDCMLYQYLVTQVAYEMACDWDKFRKENKNVMKVFESKDTKVIERLFEAVMNYTKPLDSADPAKHRKSWRV